MLHKLVDIFTSLKLTIVCLAAAMALIFAGTLAQVHLARLQSGEEVVVKALRPRIDVLVETELAAISRAVRWLKFYKQVRRRVEENYQAQFSYDPELVNTIASRRRGERATSARASSTRSSTSANPSRP